LTSNSSSDAQHASDPSALNCSGALSTPAEREQLRKLLQTQYAGVVNLMIRKLKDRELANDLVNEAVAITLEQLRASGTLQIDNVAGYVFRVSLNLLRNHRRHSNNRSDLRVDMGALESVPTEVRDDVEAIQIKRHVTKVIRSLNTARDREVVKRFYLEEQEKEAICTELGLTAMQFSQITSRARQRMKSIFESEGIQQRDLYSVFI
jgi:RNA polymerase sigma-70 factor (ECF subfamily)